MIGEEFDRTSRFFAEKEIDLISLVAPTTTDERLESISASAKGFIYAVSRAGVTGAREQTSSSAEELVTRVRRFTSLPVAVGFGISTRAQIEDVWRYADAAVVGSAIVAEIERAGGKDVIPALDKFLGGLVPPRSVSGPEFAIIGPESPHLAENAADYRFYLLNAYSKRQFAKNAVEI